MGHKLRVLLLSPFINIVLLSITNSIWERLGWWWQ